MIDRYASLQDIHRTLSGAVPTGMDNSDTVVVVMSMTQAQVLADRLGWCPTPSVPQCRTTDGVFCCPTCGATGSALQHETTGGVDVRQVSGFSPAGGLVVDTDADRVPGNRGRIRCRRCHLQFRPAPGTPIDWR